MWSIEGPLSAFLILEKSAWFPERFLKTMLKESLEEWKQKYGMPPYFVKLTGQEYHFISRGLQNMEDLLCLGVDMEVSPNSFYHEFLLKPSLGLPEVKDHQYLKLSESSNNCKSIDSKFVSLRWYLSAGWFSIMFLLIGGCSMFFIRGIVLIFGG